LGKFTVLYSGNIGVIHDLSLIPALAQKVAGYADVHFLVIGAGPGLRPLQLGCERMGLANVTFLPPQTQAVLPYALATADIGVVALARGAEGISMPSKTYYMMAAGSALLGLSDQTSDLAAVIREHGCGVNVPLGDAATAAAMILELRDDPQRLRRYRENARRASETCFSKAVCLPQMLELIQANL
jgi:colanic acid biosynthesis glycosyl transferase WcaI